jgi:DNA-directed RNA polymerase specialized sigma24 family protein
MATEVSHIPAGIPVTRWSEVHAAKAVETPEGQDALNQLLSRYRPALIAHLRAKFHLNPEDAEDFLHTFVEKKVLSRKLLATVEPARGRFRNFLFASLDHFAIDELRRQGADKRGPVSGLVPLELVHEAAFPIVEPPNDSPYDLVWSCVVITGALLNMRIECAENDQLHLWNIFLDRLLQPLLGGMEPTAYEMLVRHHQLDSPSTAFNLLKSAKRKFRRHLRTPVSQGGVDRG